MEKQTIAILGWGSLIWDSKHPRAPEFDKWHEAWMDNGPRIKLEFSRISTRPPRQGVTECSNKIESSQRYRTRNVRYWRKTGSDRPTVRTTRGTHFGHR
jgi:hypothetical protein